MAEAPQLTLGLGLPPSLGREDFVIGEGNREAFAAVEAWPDWSSDLLLVCGPEGAGKSHLAAIWSEASGGRILHASELGALDWSRLAATGPIAVEDIDRAPDAEQSLFHLINDIRAAGGSMLMTARRADPGRWCVLPDLLSRLRSARPVALAAPDEPLLRMVLVKLFADRQIKPDATVLEFLSRRMERSFAAASEIVDRIVRLSLATGRSPTRPLAAEALAGLAGFDQAVPGEAK